MLRVGLTGGLASGKSYVGHVLAELGCYLVQADELGHEVLLPGAEAYEPVVQEFGTGILDERGNIDRAKLAQIVFDDPAKLEKLSSFVHPAVLERQNRIIGDIESRDPHAIIVVEAAILVETGNYRTYDRLIVVWCRQELQIERALARAGSTREQVMARLTRQLPLEEKLRVADFVIDTSGTKEDTIKQTRDVFESLRSLSR